MSGEQPPGPFPISPDGEDPPPRPAIRRVVIEIPVNAKVVVSRRATDQSTTFYFTVNKSTVVS